MTLAELRKILSLTVLAGEAQLGCEVTGGYSGDLLSDVMANAAPGSVWLTIQGHVNIVAVVRLKELAGIVLVNGRLADADALAKAEAEGVPILSSPRTAFELAGEMAAVGIGRSGE